MIRTNFSLILVVACFFVTRPAWGLGEEELGNGPVNAANYVDRPGIMPVINDTHRVYRWWVNGHEQFFYRGDSIGVNSLLEKFAGVKSDRLEVVLRPAPAQTTTFDQSTDISFNWKLQLIGGIAGHMGRRDKGENLWPPHPVLHVYVGGPIQLSELRIPDNIDVMPLSQLKSRYQLGLDSTAQDVRGWSCGQLAELDRYDPELIQAIAAKLKDESQWVRTNAALALSQFGQRASIVKPALVEARQGADQSLLDAIDKATDSLDKETDRKAQSRFEKTMEAIDRYCENRSR